MSSTDSQSAATRTMNPAPPNPREIDRIVDGWRDMVERTTIAEARAAEALEKARQTNELNIKLIAETELLQDQVARLTTELRYSQSYAIDLTTRLKMFGEMAEKVMDESRKFARGAATMPAPKIELAAADEEGLKEIFRGGPRPAGFTGSGLPVNQLNTEPGGTRQ